MRRQAAKSTLAEDTKWRDAIFDEPPARRVAGRSRPTQRSRVLDTAGGEHICEGGNELTAALLLNHFCRLGVVRRFKFQPFNLADFGGEAGYPDVLVELGTLKLFVVEIKSAKFLSEEYLDKYRARERELVALGLPVVLWTDRKAQHAIAALTQGARNNLLDIERCSNLYPREEILKTICEHVQRKKVRLAQLLAQTGATWEELMFAWAHNHIRGPVEETLHETTLFTEAASPVDYHSYFEPRAGAQSWWRCLPDLALDSK